MSDVVLGTGDISVFLNIFLKTGKNSYLKSLHFIKNGGNRNLMKT